MTEDSTLFERIKYKRDMKAYDELFRRWYAPLVKYATSLVSFADAENIVQDLMVDLWEKARKIEIHTSVSAYLHTSVRNRCLNALSHEEVRSNVMDILMMDSRSDSIATSSRAIEKELRALIREELEKLPEIQRMPFEMNRFEGKTYEQIAAETGSNIKSVEYRISQAIKKLRIGLKDYIS